jgi:hypothetical protein
MNRRQQLIRDIGKSVSITPTGVDPGAVELASESDRQWFEDHPGANSRIRLSIAGELPAGCNSVFIHVEQIEPGLRIRRPVYVTGGEN